MPAAPSIDPSIRRREYDDALPKLDTMADVMSGTEGMHAASAKYIMRWEKEPQALYDKRRVCETFFEGTKATLSAGVGTLFRKPVSVEWNGAETPMRPIWDNIDNAGTAGPVFLKRWADWQLRDGFAIAVADFPTVPDGVQVRSDQEAALNLRPTACLYSRRSAINWFVEAINNKQELTLLVLTEEATRRRGLSIERVALYRVLSLDYVALQEGQEKQWVASWTLYEEVKDASGKVTEYKEIGSGLTRNRNGEVASSLLVSIAYGGRTDAPLTADLPLLGVAWANIAHWRKGTDIEWYEKLCAFPQRVVVGDLAIDPLTNEQPKEIPGGPGVAIQVQAGGSVAWDELEGSALEQLRKSRDEKLAQVGAMGMGFMSPKRNVERTAKETRLDAEAEQATLGTAGQSLQDAANHLLEDMAWLDGIERQNAPTVTLNLQFSQQQMDAQLLVAWATACEKAGLPVRLLLEAMVRGEQLPPDTDIEALEAEVEATKAAADEQKRVEMELQQQAAGANALAA